MKILSLDPKSGRELLVSNLFHSEESQVGSNSVIRSAGGWEFMLRIYGRTGVSV